jgi:hypothetical protein
MRFAFVIAAMLALCQCASAPERARPIVILGVAEAPDQMAPDYTMLWRKVDPKTGAFESRGGARMIEFTTSSSGAIRVDGMPGEFEVRRVEPGLYALDGVYAQLREGAVTYTAQGSIRGPERPAFEARRGEVIYLGIWQVSLDNELAVVRPWRLSQDDIRAVARAADLEARVLLRETHVVSVPCTPRRMHPSLAREIC